MKRVLLSSVALIATASVLALAQPLSGPNAPVVGPNTPVVVGPNVPMVKLLEDPNPAMNNPDKVSWELFVQVNAPAATTGNNNVLFETWASNDDTFKQNPVWPGTASNKALKVPALIKSAPRRPGLQPHVVPGGGEEVRRNKPTFDFIVAHKLYQRSGLKAAFASGKPISFPIDSIEVKAIWVDAATVNAALYHTNTAAGKTFALVSMHIISKMVPNWTWATFEHQNNAGRCDIIGCRDEFGATVKVVQPKTPPGGQYPACNKTAGLKKMFTDGKLAAVFENYCLKGSQVDFTTSSGLNILLGNSVIEQGFVNTSSCLTCHSRASVNSNGQNIYGGGFVGNGSPNGPPNPTWFWNNPGKANQSLKALQTDFVWSIPREAIP